MATMDLSVNVLVYEINERGHIQFGYWMNTGTPPTNANKFGAGCLLLSSSGVAYINKGTYASPNFTAVTQA